MKNITKKTCKQALLVQLTLANFIVGIFLTLVAHSMWVTLVVAAVLTVMTALLAFYFWFDQPEWKEGFPTKSQLYRAKLNAWMTGIEIRLAERALLKAIVDLRSGERLW